jgi:hypothetical protein
MSKTAQTQTALRAPLTVRPMSVPPTAMPTYLCIVLFICSNIVLNCYSLPTLATASGTRFGMNELGWPLTYWNGPLTSRQLVKWEQEAPNIEAWLRQPEMWNSESVFSLPLLKGNIKPLALTFNIVICAIVCGACRCSESFARSPSTTWNQLSLRSLFYVILSLGIFFSFIGNGIVGFQSLLFIPLWLCVILISGRAFSGIWERVKISATATAGNHDAAK